MYAPSGRAATVVAWRYPPPLDAVENKWLATRHGLQALYIRTPSGKRRALAYELAQSIERLLPVARESRQRERYLAGLQTCRKSRNRSRPAAATIPGGGELEIRPGRHGGTALAGSGRRSFRKAVEVRERSPGSSTKSSPGNSISSQNSTFLPLRITQTCIRIPLINRISSLLRIQIVTAP